MRKIYLLTIVIMFLALIGGCVVGQSDYINFKNNRVGKKMPYKEPFKFKDAGKLIRADYLIGGQGLTHITIGKDGNLIYHFSDQEVLPNFQTKEWVGRCLTYYVVDPKTYIIKEWGFDEGGNPLSCRTWL